MSPSKSLITLFLLSSLLQGCSHNPFSQANRLDKALEQQQYDAALSYFDKLNDEQRLGLEVKRVDIEKQRDDYITNNLKAARREIGKEQWLNSQNILLESSVKVPSSKRLKNELAVLNRRIDSLEQAYFQAFQLKAAKYYLSQQEELGVWQSVSREAPPYSLSAFSEDNSRQNIAESLGRHGIKLSAKKSQEPLAIDFLSTANRLNNSSEWQAALNKIQSKKVQKARKVKKQKQAIQKLAFSDIQNSFKQQLKNKDFIAAKKTLQQARNIASNNKENQWIKEANKQVDDTIKPIVAKKLKDGQVHYSAGRIDKAIMLWQEGLRLEPNNQAIKDGLSRAKKFKETYESLK